MIALDEKFVDARIPIRDPDTNKNDYGRVTALCGCRGYTGAAYFAAQAAVRTGSGIVTLMIPQSIYPILAIKLQEPVVRPVEEDAEEGYRSLFARPIKQQPRCYFGWTGAGQKSGRQPLDLRIGAESAGAVGLGCRWHKCFGGAYTGFRKIQVPCDLNAP